MASNDLMNATCGWIRLRSGSDVAVYAPASTKFVHSLNSSSRNCVAAGNAKRGAGQQVYR